MARRTRPRMETLTKRLRAIRARDIMTNVVITTTDSTSLADIAELMIKTRISGLPVVNKRGKMLGLISAEDLMVVMDMIESGDIVENGTIAVSNPTVKFAMSTETVKIKKNTTLSEIISIMKYKNIHTIPVFDRNKMIGIIGRRDVFKKFYFTVKELYE